MPSACGVAVRDRRPVGAQVTVSIGVAVSGPGMVDTDDLLSRADAALYAAKASGRDGASTVRRLASASVGCRQRLRSTSASSRERKGREQLHRRLDVARSTISTGECM